MEKYADLLRIDSLLMFAISVTIQDVDHGGYRAKKDGWLFLPLAESAANV